MQRISDNISEREQHISFKCENKATEKEFLYTINFLTKNHFKSNYLKSFCSKLMSRKRFNFPSNSIKKTLS